MARDALRARGALLIVPDAPIALSRFAPRAVVRGVTHRYHSDASLPPVLDGIDLTLAPGEFVMLRGPTGSGKTTLMTLIGALRRHQHGTLEVLGRDLHGASEAGLTALRREIGFIFQDHHLFDALTPRETLRLAMQLKSERYSAHDYAQRPDAWLERVGLGARMNNRPAALSTGQRQCVAVARALINDPLLILADEPTASLDSQSAEVAIAALREAVRERAATVLMITHDSRQLALADRVVSLLDGRVQSVQSQAEHARTGS
jgi:putative ABC transport system ATP-binding protein